MSISDLHMLKAGTAFRVAEYDSVFLWTGERFVIQIRDGRAYDHHKIFDIDDEVVVVPIFDQNGDPIQ